MICAPLLNHLIRPLQERRRDGQAEGLGGLEVDDQFEGRGLLDGKLGRLGTFENFVYVVSTPPVQVSIVRSIRHEPTLNYLPPPCEDRRETMLYGERHDAFALKIKELSREHNERTGP